MSTTDRPAWMPPPPDPAEVARRRTHDNYRRLVRNLRMNNTPEECERLRRELEAMRAERDALIESCIYPASTFRDGVFVPAWVAEHRNIDGTWSSTKAEAVAAIRRAAGLDTPAGGGGGRA